MNTKRRPTTRVQLTCGLAGLLSLTSCATLGSNVQGSFSCSAPNGTCAPSSVIDDRALAMIGGDDPAIRPAGPYSPQPPAVGREMVAATQPVSLAGQKVLTIVFPAHVDRQGRFHETSTVRAVVDNGAWVAAPTGRGTAVGAAERVRSQQPPVDLASAVEQAPSAATITAARERGRALGAEPGPSPKPAAAVSAVPAGAPITREAIAAQVNAQLAKPAPGLNRPAAFSGRVED